MTDSPAPLTTENDTMVASKRIKLDHHDSASNNDNQALVEKYINASILSNIDKLHDGFAANKPFSHGHLTDVFPTDFMASVLAQVKDNSKVNYKESDLFKVYQSIDLGNLPSHSPLTQLLTLRRILYSHKWQRVIERLLGLETNVLLTDKVDCAFNCHTPGCHLLCHDDVIGTRKVSYILYLTDPGWTSANGGALELYESSKDNVNIDGSSPIPAKTILPIFNSMAFFEVKPNESLHSVQEVLPDSQPRLSLQGWYHAKEAPVNASTHASVNQLLQKGDYDDSTGFADFDKNDIADTNHVQQELSKSDIDYLAQYINPTYLDENTASLRSHFEENSGVQLQDFLLPRWVDMIDKARQSVPDHDYNDYSANISKAWQLQGPAHKQRHLVYNKSDQSIDTDCNPDAIDDMIKTTSPNDALGAILDHVKTRLFQSVHFARFLQVVCNLHPCRYKGQVRCFRKGLDYTVAHYGLVRHESYVLDATLCFVKSGSNDDEDAAAAVNADIVISETDAAWQSGEVGGFECYIGADEESPDAADTYKSSAGDDNDEEEEDCLINVSAQNNTLSLVFRDPGTMRFIKYVSAQAPSSRWDIGMEYEVDDTDIGQDDNDDDEEATDGDENNEGEE